MSTETCGRFARVCNDRAGSTGLKRVEREIFIASGDVCQRNADRERNNCFNLEGSTQ